jgi:hypothetical protein
MFRTLYTSNPQDAQTHAYMSGRSLSPLVHQNPLEYVFIEFEIFFDKLFVPFLQLIPLAQKILVSHS